MFLVSLELNGIFNMLGRHQRVKHVTSCCL